VPKIRVVIAESHPALLSQLCQIVGSDYEVVFTAENGVEACKAVLELQPDVILLDISMPILDGLQTAHRLRQANSGIKIILLSEYDDQDFIAAAFLAGADCYVTKERVSTDLDLAIRTALQGSHFISKSLGIMELSNGNH